MSDDDFVNNLLGQLVTGIGAALIWLFAAVFILSGLLFMVGFESRLGKIGAFWIFFSGVMYTPPALKFLANEIARGGTQPKLRHLLGIPALALLAGFAIIAYADIQ